MLKRWMDGLTVWAPQEGMDTPGKGTGMAAGGDGPERESVAGQSIGNVNPGEISDRIAPMGEHPGGKIIKPGEEDLRGGGAVDLSKAPLNDQEGSDTGPSGGSQADGASSMGGVYYSSDRRSSS